MINKRNVTFIYPGDINAKNGAAIHLKSLSERLGQEVPVKVVSLTVGNKFEDRRKTLKFKLNQHLKRWIFRCSKYSTLLAKIAIELLYLRNSKAVLNKHSDEDSSIVVFYDFVTAFFYLKQGGKMPFVCVLHNNGDLTEMYRQYFKKITGSSFEVQLEKMGIEAMEKATSVVFLGQDSLNMVLDKYGLKSSDKYVVIQNGVRDCRALVRESHGKRSRDLTRIKGCFVGSLTKRKGVDILSEVVDKLDEGDSKGKVSWEIVGEGPLEELLKDRPNVCLHGLLDNPAEVMSKCDFLILPSRDEGMPLVILEAMSLGIAIVTTKVGSISNVVRDGENGMLCQEITVGEISSKVSLLLKNPELLDAIGRRGRLDYEASYSLENMAEQYLALLMNNEFTHDNVIKGS